MFYTFLQLLQAVLLLEGASERFTGEEACRIYLQAAIVYKEVNLLFTGLF